MAGATRPVGGGAYSSPRSEPGGQNTPRAGRVVASYGTYVSALGLFAQQVDQGDIFDDAADTTAIVTASGSGVEDYQFADTASGTTTASGSGTESWSGPVFYTDATSGTVTAGGTGVEKRVYADDATYYDNALDLDNPTSHWKLGDPSTAVDRKGQRNLPAVSGPIATASGIVTNNAEGTANEFTGTANAWFTQSDTIGIGLPYQGPYTMEVWLKPTADANGGVMSRTPVTNFNLQPGTGTQTQIRHNYEDSLGNDNPLGAGTFLTVGATSHLVATHDGSTVILYVNGVERARVTGVNGTRSAPNTTPSIGGARGGTWLRGVVDEAAWYPTALTAARVLAHYQAGTVPAGVTAPGTGTITASGSGTDSYAYADAGTATVTASGTGTESYASSDTGAATVTASGTGTEKRVYGDDATYYDNVIDADSPVSHWKLGDPSTAVDRKGLLNLPAIGTTGGAITTEAALVSNNGNDKANGFTGGNRRFDANPAIGRGLPYDTDTWSIEAWANCSSYANSPYVVWRGITSDQTLFAGSSGRWVLSSKNSAGTVTQAFPAPSTLVLGQTYHVVGTYDGTDIILYINGFEAARAPMASQRHDTQFAPNISSDRSANGFEGTIDEVAWYSSALAPARVLAHYNAGNTSVGLIPPTVSASGTGNESSAFTDTGTGTVTASGTGIEVYSPPVVYTDTGSGTVIVSGTGIESYVNTQILRPDADIAVAGWTIAPLYSKLSDDSDTTVVTGVLV